MRLICGHDETVAEWVGKIVGKPFHPPFTAMGVIDHAGTLRGGFVFNGHTEDAIELSLAGSSCATRSAWAGVLDYVFDQLKCSRLSIHTSTGNKAACQQAARLGFKFEGVNRRLYGREHGVCYSLIVDDLPAFRRRWKLGQ